MAPAPTAVLKIVLPSLVFGNCEYFVLRDVLPHLPEQKANLAVQRAKDSPTYTYRFAMMVDENARAILRKRGFADSNPNTTGTRDVLLSSVLIDAEHMEELLRDSFDKNLVLKVEQFTVGDDAVFGSEQFEWYFDMKNGGLKKVKVTQTQSLHKVLSVDVDQGSPNVDNSSFDSEDSLYISPSGYSVSDRDTPGYANRLRSSTTSRKRRRTHSPEENEVSDTVETQNIDSFSASVTEMVILQPSKKATYGKANTCTEGSTASVDIGVFPKADASELVDANELVDASELVNVTKPIYSSKPINDAKPIYATEPTDVTEPTDITEPTDVTELVDATDLIDVTDYIDAAESNVATKANDTTEANDASVHTENPMTCSSMDVSDAPKAFVKQEDINSCETEITPDSSKLDGQSRIQKEICDNTSQHGLKRKTCEDDSKLAVVEELNTSDDYTLLNGATGISLEDNILELENLLQMHDIQETSVGIGVLPEVTELANVAKESEVIGCTEIEDRNKSGATTNHYKDKSPCKNNSKTKSPQTISQKKQNNSRSPPDLNHSAKVPAVASKTKSPQTTSQKKPIRSHNSRSPPDLNHSAKVPTVASKTKFPQTTSQKKPIRSHNSQSPPDLNHSEKVPTVASKTKFPQTTSQKKPIRSHNSRSPPDLNHSKSKVPTVASPNGFQCKQHDNKQDESNVAAKNMEKSLIQNKKMKEEQMYSETETNNQIDVCGTACTSRVNLANNPDASTVSLCLQEENHKLEKLNGKVTEATTLLEGLIDIGLVPHIREMLENDNCVKLMDIGGKMNSIHEQMMDMKKSEEQLQVKIKKKAKELENLFETLRKEKDQYNKLQEKYNDLEVEKSNVEAKREKCLNVLRSVTCTQAE